MTDAPHGAPLRVLFVCIHNSARSQMAEAFTTGAGAGRIIAASAGIEPGRMNPVVVTAMAEIGFDLSRATPKSVQSLIDAGAHFDEVITVCDEGAAARCPALPGPHRRQHWGFPDPSALPGTPAERLPGTRLIRDAIRVRCQAWCREMLG